MIKTIKRIILSCLSILGLSFFFWTILMLNPKFVYSNSTNIENVTVYHNLDLDKKAEDIIKNAIEIIRLSEIYNDEIQISMCMNNNSIYPELYPFAGSTAYAFLNKTVIYHSKPDFKNNRLEFEWEINNYEVRKYNLTTLLAHEFMHNVQYDFNSKYYILSTLGKINWKFEGHADYVARKFKNDGQLKHKIAKYLIEENKDHVGVPVFEIEDGTIQNLSYYKYALVIQYLMEEQERSFDQICLLETGLDELYLEMIEWSEK